MTQHSLSKALICALVVLVLLLFFPSSAVSQSNYGCPITIDGNEDLGSIRTAPRAMSMVSNYASPFMELSNIRGRDNQVAHIELAAKKSSDLLYVNDFGFDLPTGAIVLGVEVRVVGEASIPDVVRDMRVSLASGPGVSLGADKANKAFDKPWSASETWSYGSVMDHWGASITAATVNNSGFGVMLQISNRGTETVTASLDQISIRLYYQKNLVICGHPCIAIQTADDPTVSSYSWNVGGGLVSEVSNQHDNIVNVFADQSPFGEYEICLTRNFQDGSVDYCCRPISYNNCEKGSIGDRVWEDTNGNGIQDAGEPNLDDVVVRLYDESGREIAFTRTVNGSYIFTDLDPGNYVVRVDLQDFVPSIHADSDPLSNSDIENIYFYGSTGTITLGSGEQRSDIDFGLTRSGSICGHAYNDRNGDGSENAMDTPFPGVVVNLYDSSCNLLRSVMTDSNGDFCFNGLAQGDYFIAYDLEEGYVAGGVGYNNSVDITTGKLRINLEYGESSNGNDVGIFRLSEVGGFVWDDSNNNGIQDPGEEGLVGVDIGLYTCTDELVRTTSTDETGHYVFDGLNPGQYKICVENPASGMVPTLQSTDPNGSVVMADGCSACFELLDDTVLDNMDVGLVMGAGDIRGNVWLDLNNNGIQDPGEGGIGGVRLSLQDCMGNVIAETVTDEDGSYVFSAVPAGDYVICLSEDYGDYMPSLETGCTECFNHTGQGPLDMDFTLVYDLATVDTKIWIDANGNGQLEDDEELVEGIMTELYTCAGAFVVSSLTDNEGSSWFLDVPPGEYYLRAIVDSDYEFITNGGTITGQNGIGTTDCFVISGTGNTWNIGLAEVESEESILAVNLFEDTNNSGTFDLGEPALESVNVTLYSCTGLAIEEAMTGSDGTVTFSDLAPSQYYLEVELLPGLEFYAGGVIDNSFGPGTSHCFSLDNGAQAIDIIYVSTIQALRSSIAGKVWLDDNKDGVMELAEIGMSQVFVRLYDEDFNMLVQTATNDDGEYLFSDLGLGSYYVQFVKPTNYYFTEYRVGNNAEVDSEVIDAQLGMTDVVVLSSSQQIENMNAGLVLSSVGDSSVSGQVWIDENTDGLIGVDELGWSESLVILYDENGTYHSSTFTDEEGFYLFPLLPDGRYYIEFELPIGYSFSPAQVGGISEIDSEVIDVQYGRTSVFELQIAAGLTGVNAGLQKNTTEPVSIAGKVWIDANYNSLLETNEAGYTDLLVTLYDALGNYQFAAFTDADGYYFFPQLDAGAYYLDFELPDGYTFSSAQLGNNNLDSEVVDLLNGTTDIYNLTAGDNLDNVHVGLQETVRANSSISGRVWVDADRNNLDDSSEPGYRAMLVMIFDELGIFIGSTYTDEDGYYNFNQLDAGNYYVDFELPEGYAYSSAQAGNNGLDSEVVDFIAGTTDIYAIGTNQVLENINAGLHVLDFNQGSIDGTVWIDSNNNSLLDSGESGYNEMLVLLYDATGNFQASTFTDVEGYYSFQSLSDGDYYVDFDLPQAYQFVAAKLSGDLLDSEVTNLALGTTDLVSVTGNNIEGVNAGINLITTTDDFATVSGRVWLDSDEDGIMGLTESGIENIQVELLDDNNTVVETVSTIWSGHYEFEDITPGLYYVRFQLQGDRFSVPQVGGSSNRDSEVVNGVDGNTALFILTAGQELGGVNAGMIEDQIVALSSISGQVWIDADQDGLIGNSENGKAGIAVTLIDDNNIEVSETTTSVDGSYTFPNLEAGLYYVRFDVPGYEYTSAKVAGNSTEDSEVVNGVAGNTALYVLGQNEDLIGINAGLIELSTAPLGSIAGLVWVDLDEDGMADASELGADKVVVVLLNDNNDELATIETTWTGTYVFENLPAGLYYVRFETTEYSFTLPKVGGSSLWDSEVVNAIGGNTSLYILSQGEELAGINAGVVALPQTPATIAGMVWLDEDRDGLISAIENGAEGVIVHLVDGNNIIVESLTTEVDGLYNFDNLVPGLYYLRYEIPDNTFFTLVQSGGNSDLDSDVVNIPNANTALYVLSAGQTLSGINAGIYQESTEPVSIAGRVWLDADEDGVISATETGIENVVIDLVDETNTVVESTFSDADGAYSFTDIAAGLYHVSFDISDNYRFTMPQIGGNSSDDSEVLNFASGKTANYVLAAGDNLSGVNAGLIERENTSGNTEISGMVWEDHDGDGTLSANEFGSASIPVRLLDINQNLVSIVSTNGLGEYNFAGLNIDKYYVEFILPLDSKATIQFSGTNTLIDSDITEVGMTELIDLSVTDGNGVNAGYYYPVSIGDWVWLDYNEDGIQSPDEPGANNYIINLYDAENNFLQRVWTQYNDNGEPGYYLFNDLMPGEYYIKVTPQSGMGFSPSGQASAENDSDLTDANGFGTTDKIFLASGSGTLDIDIGLILAPAKLGDRLWIDENGNGIQDDNENGLNDVVVELYNSLDILVGTTTTGTQEGEDGYYLFEELYPTEYYIKFLLSDEYITTVADMGGVDSKDSDIDNSNGPGTTSIFLLSPGETDLDLDGGVYFNAFIGDKVWHDRNLDGMQDSNEPGVENVKISLYKLTNGTSTFIASTVTDRFGEYRFPDLANGDYYLVFEPTDDFEMTEMDMGTDETLDSDASKTGVSDVVTISNNTSVASVDVGLVRPDNQLSGFAWLDLNKNGTYETDEALLEGITIWLMQGGTLISEETTGPGGRYLFDDLDDEDYYMNVELSSDYDFTTPNFGIDEDLDSDFDYSGNSETFTFTGQDVFRNINLGLIDISKKKSTLYPNPLIGTTATVSIYVYADDLAGSYKILDNMGQVFKEGTLANRQTKGKDELIVPVEELDAGIYFLKLKIGRQVEHIKFTKLSR